MARGNPGGIGQSVGHGRTEEGRVTGGDDRPDERSASSTGEDGVRLEARRRPGDCETRGPPGDVWELLPQGSHTATQGLEVVAMRLAMSWRFVIETVLERLTTRRLPSIPT